MQYLVGLHYLCGIKFIVCLYYEKGQRILYCMVGEYNVDLLTKSNDKIIQEIA